MRFVSTRGGAEPVSFEDAVLMGWAADGGMLMPATIPQVPAETLEQWRALPYAELAAAVLRLFVDESEISTADLAAVTARSFGRFGTPEVVPMRRVELDGGAHVTVAELWHGPTLAFKDLGMQVLGEMLRFFLKRRGERRMILVSTSGDTGSSAIEAVRGAGNMDILVLFPDKGRISDIQRLQMTSVQAPNVHVWGMDGSSDDLDIPLMAVFQDSAFRQRYALGSLNSVNICRVLVQVVHFVHGYLQASAAAAPGASVTFVVPTGAAGNLTAGVIALKMGVPIARMCAATNSNETLHRWDSAQSPAVNQTLAAAMDIQVPYNIERIFHVMTNSNSAQVKHWMAAFYSTGRVELDAASRALFAADLHITSTSVADDRIAETVKAVYAHSDYLLDPHSAVGVAAVRAGAAPASTDSNHTVCLACAHPAKFPATVASILGRNGDDAAALPIPNQDHPCVKHVVSLYTTAAEHKAVGKDADWEQEIRRLVVELDRKHTQ